MGRILDGKTTWRVHAKAKSALLVDGRDYYAAFYEAAMTAKRSICLLGWQFDSDVLLLRGDDAPPDAGEEDLALLAVLDRLCRTRPDLEVRILAWDHSFVFALERELLQKVIFDVITCERLRFEWDGTVPLGGSHHQKVAVVDGRVAFVGSQDLCQSRWDESSHRADNPLRVARFDLPHKPYHEVQAVVVGAPVRTLLELFVDRWRDATGEVLDPASLVHAAPAHADEIDVGVTLPMPPATLGISRTIPEVPGREPIFEVRQLLVRAIEEAERLVYVETQYLTSCAVREALVERMKDRSRPKLDIVVVLPHKPEKLKEELTIGLPQNLVLARLEDVARRYGHRLGVYNVVAPRPRGDGSVEDVYVYVHSKLMIVDDRFMTVGSANFTNRSMTLDSEVNLAWEAAREDHPVRNAIRRARVRLLLEHVGESARVRDVVASRGLVDRLEACFASGQSRLRHHEIKREEPSGVARKVQELTCELLDPRDGSEDLMPISRPSAA